MFAARAGAHRRPHLAFQLFRAVRRQRQLQLQHSRGEEGLNGLGLAPVGAAPHQSGARQVCVCLLLRPVEVSSLVSSTRITHDFHMSMMLGDGYHRLNPQLPRNIPLDAGGVSQTLASCCVSRIVWHAVTPIQLMIFLSLCHSLPTLTSAKPTDSFRCNADAIARAACCDTRSGALVQ